MEPLRVGLIGCGGIAIQGHLPAYRVAARAGLATLVGVCDLDLTRAQTAAAVEGVPAFGSAAALLEQTRPDVVSVTTHPSSHLALVSQALAAGCHVLCEKPIAMNLAEAGAMVAAAAGARRLLSICFEYRTWDEAVHVRERIRAGDLGHVYAIRTWGGEAHGFPRSSYFHRWATAGGGVLTHWTIHNLDLALWLLDQPEPLTASAFGYQRLAKLPTGVDRPPGPVEATIEDFAAGFIRLQGDTVLTVEANWLQPPSARPEGWELLGDRGAASISPLRLWRDDGQAWEDVTPPAGTLAPCDYDMTRLITGFLQAVRAGGPAPVSGPEILRVQALMDALYASMASGREVAVADAAARAGGGQPAGGTAPDQ